MVSVLLLCLLAATGVASEGTLSGKVLDEQGLPIAGATVDVYTAKPQVGSSITCPSCYRDCAKFTKTGNDGRFRIERLDTQLRFRVLVMAPGRRAQLSDWVDPDRTELEIKLEAIPGDLPFDRMLTGRVIDGNNKPIAGAVVTTLGAKTAEKHLLGSIDGVDEAAVSDQDGHFVITSRDSKRGIDVRISAPGFADSAMLHLNLNGSRHDVRMIPGAAVLGKLIFQGRPVADRSIGIVQKDRSMQSFVGETVSNTDSSGSFHFSDLQPDQEYVLYTLCEQRPDNSESLSLGIGQPVLKTQALETGSSGHAAQLGQLELMRGVKLAGKLTFKDATIPTEPVTIRLSRDPAWDWCETTLSKNGGFSLSGLPPEVYSVTVVAEGFEIDTSVFRYMVTGPSQFAIRLGSDGESSTSIQIPMRAAKR